MLGAARLIVIFFSVCFIGFGIAIGIAAAGDGGLFTGGILLVIGIAGLVVIASERMRYHGEEARPATDIARAGGEAPGTPLPPGFTATDEVFTDPSTQVRMRGYADAAGDRRYVPEPPVTS